MLSFIRSLLVRLIKIIEKLKKEISNSIDELAVTLKSSKYKKESDERIEYSVIRIDGGKKETIRKQLEILGITDGFVYPDINHQSEALLKMLKSVDSD
ncbi:hypothetical protein GPU80_02195 [Streptococcus thermophilus]|nr:hypothetical protein [Streptococcus thermophilus]